jgi:hypothetical protein
MGNLPMGASVKYKKIFVELVPPPFDTATPNIPHYLHWQH